MPHEKVLGGATVHHVWRALAEALGNGRRAFLVMVAENSEGSPGTAGVAMVVSEEGRQIGTIGGGRMELDLVQRAHEALDAGTFEPEARRLWHRKGVAQGETSGLICSGYQTNVCILCEPARDCDMASRILALVEQGRPGIVSLSPLGLEVMEQGLDLDEPATQLIRAAGGEWRCTHQLLNRKRIAIIGGGHCGRALSRVMCQLGYHVSVFDCRSAVETFAENPWAHRKEVISDYAEAGPRIDVPATTWVVVMTTDYPSDVRGLLGVSAVGVPFTGVMGSLAKINRIKQDLRRAGVSQEWLDQVRAPVGVQIHSHTPEEIAISVAAEIVKDFYEKDPGRAKPAPADERELDLPTDG